MSRKIIYTILGISVGLWFGFFLGGLFVHVSFFLYNLLPWTDGWVGAGAIVIALPIWILFFLGGGFIGWFYGFKLSKYINKREEDNKNNNSPHTK